VCPIEVTLLDNGKKDGDDDWRDARGNHEGVIPPGYFRFLDGIGEQRNDENAERYDGEGKRKHHGNMIVPKPKQGICDELGHEKLGSG